MQSPKTISFVCAKRNGRKSRPRFPGQGFALRRVSFCSHKRRQKPRASPLGNAFSRPHFFCLAKRNGVGPPKKSAHHASVRPSIDRRMRPGHTKRFFPLSLVPAKEKLPATHGRAPNSGICWKQACPVGPAEFYNCQESGSGN